MIPPIIVKFTRRGVKDDLYKARTKLKDVTTGNIGLGRQGENKICGIFANLMFVILDNHFSILPLVLSNFLK